jgi:hypothetical protein
MTKDLMGIEKIDTIINAFLAKIDSSLCAEIDTDFSYWYKLHKISYAIVIDEVSIKHFMNNFHRLAPDINCDPFLACLSHEIGHAQTCRLINEDEEMCDKCREKLEYERDHSEDDVDKNDDWRQFLDEDEKAVPAMEGEEEMLLSQIEEEEARIKAAAEMGEDADEEAMFNYDKPAFELDDYSEFKDFETELTEELILEGLAREFVRKVQSLRKDADFVITDHINIYYNGTEAIDKMLDMYKDYIMGEVLGEKLVKDDKLEEYFELNDEKAAIKVERV